MRDSIMIYVTLLFFGFCLAKGVYVLILHLKEPEKPLVELADGRIKDMTYLKFLIVGCTCFLAIGFYALSEHKEETKAMNEKRQIEEQIQKELASKNVKKDMEEVDRKVRHDMGMMPAAEKQQEKRGDVQDNIQNGHQQRLQAMISYANQQREILEKSQQALQFMSGKNVPVERYVQAAAIFEEMYAEVQQVPIPEFDQASADAFRESALSAKLYCSDFRLAASLNAEIKQHRNMTPQEEVGVVNCMQRGVSNLRDSKKALLEAGRILGLQPEEFQHHIYKSQK